MKSCEMHSRPSKSENSSSRKSFACGYFLARATGLEPATTGSTVRLQDAATLNNSNKLEQDVRSKVPTVVPTPSRAASSSQLPPDLALVVASWDRLPEAIKAGVLALVQAAGGPNA